jgi:hypothetical protein
VQAATTLRMIHENRQYIEMDMAYPHAEWVLRDALAAVGIVNEAQFRRVVSLVINGTPLEAALDRVGG